MTTTTLERPGRRFLGRVQRALLGAVAVAVPVIRARARPVLGHLREHFYGLAGLGCIDAAAFVHSTFTGLLVTGISLLVFEWKVSE